MNLPRCVFAFLCLLGLLLGRPKTASAADPAPLLVREARARGLAHAIPWLRLVHYEPGSVRQWSSDISGRAFFLSPDGDHDPDAELEATLTAFLTPLVPGHEDDHPLCRFPARRAWLDEELHFEARLHAPSCPALTRYLAALDTESVAVVFAANFLKNPASAFGHTFLRLKKRRPAGVTVRSELLDYGIDFVATTDTKNPFLYAFKGITGLFPGQVHFLSFDAMAREYGNEDERDQWAYELAFTPEEVMRLELHLWELSRPTFTYLFLTKNCSYEVLAALEAAAPRLDLLAQASLVVVPKETVRALEQVPGLIRGVGYRPSLRSQYEAQVARLTPEQVDVVARLSRDPNAPLPEGATVAEQVALLDTALFVFDARTAPEAKDGDHDVALARTTLVHRREALSTTQPPPAPAPAPLDKRPDRGHAAGRFTLGSGATTQYGGSYATFGYRLALHDLVDFPDGEPELLQVQFLDTHLRWDVAKHLLTLDTLTFAEVVALNPLTRFEKVLSWRARAVGMRLHDRGCPDCFAHGLDASVGVTLATDDEHLALFAMADAYVLFSGTLDGIAGSFVRVGVGPYGGLRARLPGNTVGVVTAGWSYLPGAHLAGTFDLRASLRMALTKDVALGIEGAAQPASLEGQFSSYFYF